MKRADKNFEAEKYVEATADYLHLLSLDPMSHDLNFKYGTCLLYNSNQKEKAIRYLNYAVLSETADPRSHYFRGKALHLNFEFEAAKQEYKTYLSKRSKPDKRYNVEREIEMCDNGKRLLTTFTDIIVAEKKEIDQSKFFRIYSDSKTIGGEILVTEKFQSKLDKKLGHVPIVHFPPNATAIYYSSYGEDLSTGKDIYIRRRLPNGGWGDPQILPGNVNTNEDEDFPYMHPSGNFLYFSSTGHNSMGGYDIFMSRYDPNSNSFKTPENVDFAISSPDDDLFYVVDSLFQNAYFASSRQSADGNLHVYRVKVARVPIQEVIIMGDFLSEINPENKSMDISITNHSNGQEVGDIKSNDKGKYSFVFPQGGKYDYLVEVEGSEDQYKFTVELPFLSEFRPLKQRVIHLNEDGVEMVRIVNLFDEDVEGADALIAEVIRKKSELDVNIDKFDLEAIELENNKKAILAAVGFDNMSLSEIADQLEQINEVNEDNAEIADRIQSNIDSEILAKTERIQSLDAIEKELLEKAEAATDPVVKHRLLNEAKRKAEEKEELVNAVQALADLREEATERIGLPQSEVDKLTSVSTALSEAVANNDEQAAIGLLNDNTELINEARSGSPDGVVDEYIQEIKTVREEIKALKEKELQYDREIEAVNTKIQTLEAKLWDAKKKDAEKYRSEIAQLEEELALLEEERDNIRRKIQEQNKKASALDAQIASLQNAIATETIADVNTAEVEESIKEVEEIADNSERINYDEEIQRIEDENPEAFGVEPETSDPLADIRSEQEEKEEAIRSNDEYTELEQMYQLIENNQDAISATERELETIEEELKEDPENTELNERKEALEEYVAELEDENKQHSDKAEELRSGTPDAALSKEDIIAEVDPEYGTKLEEVESDDSMSEREKLEAKQKLQSEFIADLNDELNTIEEQLQADPENSEAEARKSILESVKAETESSLNDTQVAINNLSDETGPAETVSVNDVLEGHQEAMATIEEDNSLTPLEKQEQLKEQEEELITAIEKEQKRVEKKLKRDTENDELLDRKQALNQMLEVTQSSIAERDQTIAALAGTSDPIVANIDKNDLINEIDDSYKEEKDQLQKEAEKTRAGVVSLLELETEFLVNAEAKKEALNEQLENDPEDQELISALNSIEEIIDDTKGSIGDLQRDYVSGTTDEEKDELITAIDPAYAEEIKGQSDPEAIVDREVQLQMAISQKIQELDSENKRGYSVSVELEKRQYEQLLEESLKREEAARTKPVVADINEELIQELRSENEVQEALTVENNDLTALNEQDALLAKYEAELDDRIAAVTKKLKRDDDNEDLKRELKTLDEEKKVVQEKRRKIRISIGEIEVEPVAELSEEADPELNALKTEQEQLEVKLTAEDLSKTERKELEKELEENLADQVVRENKIIEETIEVEEKESEELNEELNAFVETESGSAVSSVLEGAEDEEAIIEDLKEEASKAKTEEERNFILREIEERQETLNATKKEVLAEAKTAELEKEEGVSLMTREELEQKKRTFTIRIGEISNEIVQKEEEIAEAKKKDQPELIKEKETLIKERDLYQKRLEQVDDQLAQIEGKEPVVDPVAMKEPITFNEERKLAATEEYEAYEKIASEALAVEDQITNLEEELKDEKRAVASLIEEGATSDDPELKAHIDRIKTIESDVDRLKVDLVQRKWEADNALPRNKDEAMRMQNLVARGVKPIKTTLVAASLLSLPSTGLSINESATESVYSESNPIPVGVENPSGLFYRVQIGAFARPIPQDLFKEFNPVSGEKIEGSNITRYMAGFFSSVDDVTSARGQIRELGYSDAFVVAYCDGKRIPWGVARRMQEEGTCVPKGTTSELMVEVATKTAESLGMPTSREVPEVPEYSYHDAPGAVDADPIEKMPGLFFTVQIGVYNRPVDAEALKNMPEVITLRLPNGQIRYSSGRFDSVEDALPRRNDALNKGIKGAFVTAYYEGQRISLAEARRLLAEKGPSILQSNMGKEEEPVVDPVVPPVVRTDTVTTEPVSPVADDVVSLRVQVVTKKSFEDFPRDVLNRYNAEGSFYFDEKDRKVKSIIYPNEDYLPRLYNFVDDIDTVYIPVGLMDDEMTKILEVTFTDSIIPGDFMDKMLRFNYRRAFITNEFGVTVRIFGVAEENLNAVLNEIREFGVEPIVREETELEIQLEESEETEE